MSSASAFFSSSSRSTRSTKALSWSLAKRWAVCSSLAAAAAVAIGYSSHCRLREVSKAQTLRSSRDAARPQHYTENRARRAASVLWACFFECRLLIGGRFLLMLGAPFVVGHAVDDLAALVLGHRQALGVGRVLHPVGQAVAAEAGQIHQVDVLHVGAAAKMLDQAAIHRGFEFRAGFFIGSRLGSHGRLRVLVKAKIEAARPTCHSCKTHGRRTTALT